MNLTHGVLSLTLAAGLAGSVAAYRAAAGEAATTPPAPVARSAPPARQVVLPGARFAWAPCRPGAHLERGTCVVEVVQTVVLPGSAPASSTGGGQSSTPVRDPRDEEESDDRVPEVEDGDGADHDDEGEHVEAEDSDDDVDEADEADEAEDHGEDHENGEDGEDEPDEDQPGDDG